MRHLTYLLVLILFACHSEGTTDTQIAVRSDQAVMSMAIQNDAPCDQPSVTWRLTNPVENGDTIKYDAEFIADQDSIQMDGMNIRFFYALNRLDFLGVTDYAPGYGYPGGVNQTLQVMHPSSGPGLFGFSGAAVRVGYYMETINEAEPIYLNDWTKLYSLQFRKKIGEPVVILDKERIEDNGGFAPGSEGVTIVVRLPGQDLPVNVCEFVQHVNWVQTKDRPIFGHPIN